VQECIYMVDIYSERYYKSKCLEYNLVLQKGYNVSFNLISLWIVSSALCARGQNELKDFAGNSDSDKSVRPGPQDDRGCVQCLQLMDD
jgi:hypothetical protein